MNMEQKITRLERDTDVVMRTQDNLKFMGGLEDQSMKLIVTSPPYNIGKSYEKRSPLDQYIQDQAQVISECVRLLHPNGNPQRITDVQEVHPVNTDDIDVIDLLPEYLKAKELNNLRVQVHLSEDKQTYFARLDELGIEQAAYTRSDLVDALQAELEFLWNNIAKETDEKLSPKARVLKEALQKFFQEMS